MISVAGYRVNFYRLYVKVEISEYGEVAEMFPWT